MSWSKAPDGTLDQYIPPVGAAQSNKVTACCTAKGKDLDSDGILGAMCRRSAILAATAVVVRAWSAAAQGACSQNLVTSGINILRQTAIACRGSVIPCYKIEFVPEFILSMLAVVRVFFRSRGDTALEVLALRQQVAVLQRKRPRPLLNSLDRLGSGANSERLRLWPSESEAGSP
jgi:hypothetical protein